MSYEHIERVSFSCSRCATGTHEERPHGGARTLPYPAGWRNVLVSSNRFDVDSEENCFDLCATCAEAFRAWMADERLLTHEARS